MKIKVLVFEDDTSLRGMLSRILVDEGYEVRAFGRVGDCCHTFATGGTCAEALACCDAILSDVRMPGVNGIEFFTMLADRACTVPNIALMSGYWTAPDLERAAELGCHVLRKPFTPQELFRWLEEATGRG